MKKKYISPALYTVKVGGKDDIMQIIVSGSTVEDEGDIGWVKEDRGSTSRDSYNVWDDDWSKQ